VPLIIYAAAVVAWPVGHRREWLKRAVASVLLLPVVILPGPILLAALAEMPLHPASFSADSQHALMQPFVFMELGGLWLLPLAAACLSIRATASRS
jgi:hypothetical protein